MMYGKSEAQTHPTQYSSTLSSLPNAKADTSLALMRSAQPRCMHERTLSIAAVAAAAAATLCMHFAVRHLTERRMPPCGETRSAMWKWRGL